MHAYQFAYGLVFDLRRWLTIAFTVFALSACGTTDTSLTQTITAKLPTAAPTSRSTPVVTPAATAIPSNTAWKTYQNDRAGYTIDYPAAWKINERIDSDGADVTTFSPDDNGMGVTVIVQNGGPAGEEIPDMPNTRCQPAKVDGLSGWRCVDAIASSVSTTLLGQGKQYTIVSSSKNPDRNIYQRFLESFSVTP